MVEPVTPHSLDAEKAVLGAILVNGELFFAASSVLAPDDFFRYAHGLIFRAMRDLATAATPIDALTVAELLSQRKQLDDIDGQSYLFRLTDGVPRSTNVEAYAAIVLDLAQKRRLMQALTQALGATSDSVQDAEALIDEAERLIFAVSQTDARSGFVGPQALAVEAHALLQQLAEHGQTTGVLTGFPVFDDMVSGFQPGTLTLVAARPGAGKSAWALNVAFHAARAGHAVAFLSLEMSRQEVLIRLVSSATNVDSWKLRRKRGTSDMDNLKIGAVVSAIDESKLHIDDTGVVSALDIRGKARRLKAKHGLGLLIVDYLQLMKTGQAENRNLAIADISRSLKLLARELEIPVVALSQLSRETERRGDKRPLLSDLRDSGALEQDADIVVFIHRPEMYAATPENAGVAELIIAKNRSGPTGTVRLRWSGETTRFDNWSDRCATATS